MIRLIVGVLATWRLTHMFMYESGPWHFIVRLRAATGVRHDDEGLPVAWPDGNVFECFLCFSVWVGAVVSLIPGGPLLMYPFALSGAAILIERGRRNGES